MMNQIKLLAELTDLIQKLQDVVEEYCRELTAEQEERYWEKKNGKGEMHF
jgi:hypothetical protein